ncbi:MCP four helix bundle domain-containing protein, partial [Nostoc sp. NIES-2111]
MRLTIKAKLGLAFGAIVALSAATGAIAFISLVDLNASIHTLAGRAHRIESAEELKAGILANMRAERDLIASRDEAQTEKLAGEIDQRRSDLDKLAREIEAAASPQAKPLMQRVIATMDAVAGDQKQVVELARQHSMSRAVDALEGPAAEAQRKLDAVMDTVGERAAGSRDAETDVLRLRMAKMALWLDADQLTRADSVEDLASRVTAVSAATNSLEASGKATVERLAAGGIDAADLKGALAAFVSEVRHVVETARGGGTLKADALSRGTGAKAVAEVIKAVDDYRALTGRLMAEAQSEADAEAKQSETVVVIAVAVSALAALAFGIWLVTLIGRGLRRAGEV